VREARFSAFGRPDEVIELVEQPDPGAPAAGEVLIDSEFAPINPADLLNFQGSYGATKPKLPATPGAEGVGRVAAVGEGVRHVKVGDRVILPGPGTWRERATASANAIFALPEGIDPRQLAMLRVNPPTAYLMLHEFVAPKAGNWLIQNAANSGVGHCLIAFAREAGVRTVNVVRREELVAPLRARGADVVLVDAPDLDARVRQAIGEGALPLAIDAIGGAGTQRLARCVSDGGTVVNYGLLSGEPCRIDGRETVFRDVRLRGFWLRKWFLETPPQKIAALYRELAARLASGVLAVEVEAVYPFGEIRKALAHAARPGRSGKVLMEFSTK
jgi:NADPH:quinone reductase-like Zn-dependent oxidoreductase